MKTVEAGDPKRAAEDIATSSDSRNLMSAVKVLARYGLVVTYPEDLGPEDEPAEVELTDEGQQYADDYNVTEDPQLRSPDEEEAAAPEGPPGTTAPTDTGGEEMLPFGGEQPAATAEPGLELASYFREIHNWSKILKD